MSAAHVFAIGMICASHGDNLIFDSGKTCTVPAWYDYHHPLTFSTEKECKTALTILLRLPQPQSPGDFFCTDIPPSTFKKVKP